MTDLQPGPELDALVAEKVMGWVRRKGSWYETHRPERCSAKDGGFWVGGLRRTDVADMFHWFRPSTSIADAWEVVEKVNHNGVSLDLESPMGCDTHWVVVVDCGEGVVNTGVESAPYAICLAALRAVE